MTQRTSAACDGSAIALTRVKVSVARSLRHHATLENASKARPT